MDTPGSLQLAALIKNLDLEKPTIRSLIPKWHVTLVLRSLQQAPYEHLAEASIRDVTYKMVFLLALASAKRVSELHTLSYAVSRRGGWASMTPPFIDDFIAKTQVPGDPSTAPQPFEVPALTTTLGPDDSDQLRCLVRMVREYLPVLPPLGRAVGVSSWPRTHQRRYPKHFRTGSTRCFHELTRGPLPKAKACKVMAQEVRAITTSLVRLHALRRTP